MRLNNHSNKTGRRPLVALLLSLGATGLGHIYCGKLAKGLILFFISFAFAPIIVISTKYTASTFTLMTILLSVLLIVAVFFYAMADSWRLAGKTGSSYELSEYNKWYIYLIFIIVALTYPTNLYNSIVENVVQAFRIPTGSMSPGILRNDFVFLNKLAYLHNSPKRGDVAIFIHPNKRHQFYIKRIVALPGDTLELIKNTLHINNRALAYGPAGKQALASIKGTLNGDVLEESLGGIQYNIILAGADASRSNYPKTVIPNGYCFVMGDNRHHAEDSRQFGPIPLRDVKGRVDFIYLPAGNWSRFGKFGK